MIASKLILETFLLFLELLFSKPGAFNFSECFRINSGKPRNVDVQVFPVLRYVTKYIRIHDCFRIDLGFFTGSAMP